MFGDMMRDRAIPFLFPGMRADRPMTLATGQARLCKLAIPSARTARNGWLALVGSVYGKMLADLLGVADTTASVWHRENRGDHASYVASRLCQEQGSAAPKRRNHDSRRAAGQTAVAARINSGTVTIALTDSD
jgi:hypothetical protein